MGDNLGKTSLKRKRRSADPMRDFDRLPPELRVWLASAVLPWRPHSVRRAYDKVMARTQNKTSALKELDCLQSRRIAKDARHVWGQGHPHANQDAGM